MTVLQTYNEGLVTWTTFAYVAVVAAVAYAALRLLRRRLERGLYLRDADGPVRDLVRAALLFVEPLAGLVLLAVFVAIAPFVHGLIALLLIVLAARHLRDYIAGRVLRLDRGVQAGRQVSTHGLQGAIASFGLTSLYLQRDTGRARIPYTELLDGGYTVASDPARGGYYHVQVVLPEGERASGTASRAEQAAAVARLRQFLTDSPYAREGFRLERYPGDDDDALAVDLSVGVHRAAHVRYLVGSLQEAGYAASLNAN